MDIKVSFTITATGIVDTKELAKKLQCRNAKEIELVELAKKLQGRNAKEIEKKFVENRKDLENDILDSFDFDTAKISASAVHVENEQTQLDKINTICTQIAELREQLDQIRLDLKAEYNERVATCSLGGLESGVQDELVIKFLENAITCLKRAEDEITKVNLVHDEGE